MHISVISFHNGKPRIAKVQLDNSDLVKGHKPCPYEMMVDRKYQHLGSEA